MVSVFLRGADLLFINAQGSLISFRLVVCLFRFSSVSFPFLFLFFNISLFRSCIYPLKCLTFHSKKRYKVPEDSL